MLLAEQTRSVLKPAVMASWVVGLSSSLGSCLGQMSHSVVSFTRHISRCTKDVWMMEYKMEESNELRRKEVETTKESVIPKVKRFMTFSSDLDLESKQETAVYSNILIKGDLDIKLFTGKEILEKQKLQNLQEDTQSVNVAAGFISAMSSTSEGENIDPKASEYQHELQQKNLEMTILRERHKAMNCKVLKLQKATISINGTTSLVSPTPASISLGDNIHHNDSEYEHQLEQQNLEMKILRGRNVAMKRKLLKLQKATECLNVAAGLLPAMTSASLGENINPIVSEYKHELEQKNLEVKILRGRNVAMKHKLLNLQKATQCLNVAAGLVPATSASASLAENIDHKASEFKDQLGQQNLEMKILRGRNVAMKHKLLKLQKATRYVNAAADLVPATSSASLGENIDANTSECKHELKQKKLEVKILREGHGAMNRNLLKLENATESTNTAASLIAATSPSSSLGDNIDHKASEYEHQLEQQNLKMKILRGRNVAMKRKLLKLQKATECLNVAAGLLPAMSSTSLGENINPIVSEYEHELEQKNLEVKILRGRNIAMTRKLLKLQKATECLNAASGLLPAMTSASLCENIDLNASEYKHELEQKNLEMKILRGRNVAMKHKLLSLQKATQCLNVAAGLLPAMSSASLGENIDPNASEYKHELERKNLEMKILRERHRAMKCKLFKLQKATESINASAGLLPATSLPLLGENIDLDAFECKRYLEQNNLEMKILRESHGAMKHKFLKVENATESINLAVGLVQATSPSTSLGDNIDRNATEYEHVLKQQNLEMMILRGRNVTMKHKPLKLQRATECLNVASVLIPATSLALLGENIDPSASEYEHELKKKNLEVKILKERHGAMECKFLKLQKATESINMTTSLVLPTPASIFLGDNIHHNDSEYEHQLEQQNLEMKILRGRNVAMKRKLLKLQKATECLNVAAGLLPAMTSASLGENINPIVSEYKHELEQKNLEVKILRGRNVAMKHKLLNLQKATQCLNVAAGLVPATSASASLAENIDHKASEFKDQLGQQNLEMKILRGRNVAMKHKLLKLQKATRYVNAAADLVPATSSASLGENIDANTSECKHELKQKKLEVKILREGHGAMNRNLLKLENATESTNTAASLIAATSPSSSLGDNIDHKASEYEHQLEQQNLKMKILRGRNVAMKRKLLKLQKATECLNVAAGLLPAMSSTSLGENINPIVSEYEHELEQKNLEVKILRGRNIAMTRKLLKLQKATECLNAASGLLPAMTSASLCENIDLNASEYKHELEQKNLEMKILRGRNVAMKHKLLSLQKATQCLNVAAGLLPAMSSASLGENIDPNASEYKHELERKNLEMKILRERHRAMKCKLFKLQKATESINASAGLLPATSLPLLGENIDLDAFECKRYLEQNNLEMKILRESHGAMKHKFLKVENATESINLAVGLVQATSPSTSLGDNIDRNATEYEHVLKQQNLEMMILRGRNVTMKHKPLKLQRATECLNVASVLIPATSLALLGENIDPSASEYEHELKKKNLEVKILKERHGAMECKFLKLQKATESINMTTSLVLPTPASIFLGDNIHHNDSEYEHQLEQQNLEMKILRGRNVAMKHKLLKLQKATECLNVAAGLLPAMSSSLDENINPNASEYEHELEQKNLEVKILRGRNVAMKHKLLNLQKATQCLNVAAGLVPAIPASASLAENIDHKASEFKGQLGQQNLEMKILRGRNVAMKHKLLKLLKASRCLNVADGLVPATSSASLGENIDANASECKHELKQKNLEMKILREGHGAMNRKLLKLENATESTNTAASLIAATSPSSSLGDNIDHKASEYEHQLEQQNLKMKILRGRNVAMKRKLLKLQKATECLNAAAGLLPAMTSASLGENIDPNASEYKHELEQKNLEVKILRGRNVAMKHKLLNLQKTTQCLNAEAGLLPTVPVSTSLGNNIDHNASEYENQLKQKNLEMKILKGRNVAMKHKLLSLQKATQCLNVAAGLLPATSSASLGENIDPNVSEYKHQLIKKNLETKVLREKHAVMKRKLLKLQKATESTNAAAGLVPAMPASTSLVDNVDPNAFDHHQLELKNISHHASIDQHLPKQHDLVDLFKSIFNIF